MRQILCIWEYACSNLIILRNLNHQINALTAQKVEKHIFSKLEQILEAKIRKH